MGSLADRYKQYEKEYQRGGSETPPGVYECGFDKVEVAEDRQGRPVLKSTFRVLEGDLAGRLIFHRYPLSGNAVWTTHRDMKIIGADSSNFTTLEESFDLILSARVDVEVKYEPDRNDPDKKWARIRVLKLHGHDYTPESAPSENGGGEPGGNAQAQDEELPF